MEVGLNSRCLLNWMFNDGDIDDYQKRRFYRSAQAFYETAYKYSLNNLPHSDDLLKHAEVVNWETRKDASTDSLGYFVKR